MGGRCGGGVCLVITVATWSIICMLSSTVAELSRLEHPITKTDGQLRFLVIGDWGRKGKYNQSQVALQMGIIGEKLNIDFVISVGDNFYEDGLTSVDDPAFDESFSNIYNMKSLGKQWYNVLGNHDYRGDVEAQLSPILRKVDERWICMRSFIVNAEFLDIFFVDTTPFVNKYFINPDGHTYDWRGVLPRETYIKNLLMDVDSSLKESDAKWKIVVGHHTMRSAGEHGDTEELVKQLLPILEANGVDLYVNGHDHCLQHISNNTSNIQFLTSGGGSKAWRGGIDLKKEGLKFYYDGQGFMSIQLTKEFANIVFYDIFGDILHKLSLSKNLYMGTKTYVQ